MGGFFIYAPLIRGAAGGSPHQPHLHALTDAAAVGGSRIHPADIDARGCGIACLILPVPF